MARNAIVTGFALVVLGVVVSIASDSASITSWLPAIIGVVFVALGAGARIRPDMGRHLMHAAAGLALVVILASLGSAIGRRSTGWALFSQIATAVIAGAFMVLAIRSFRAARRARPAEQGA